MLLALLGSSTVLFHQIAGYTLAVLLGVISILFPPYLLRRDGRRGVYLLLSLAALGIFSVFYAWTPMTCQPGGGNARRFGDGEGGEAVAMAIGTKPANGPGYFLMTPLHQPLARPAGPPVHARRPPEREGHAGHPGTPHPARVDPSLFFGSLTSYSGFRPLRA